MESFVSVRLCGVLVAFLRQFQLFCGTMLWVMGSEGVFSVFSLECIILTDGHCRLVYNAIFSDTSCRKTF